MRILYIIHDNKKGGAALSFLNMLKGVSKQHDVFVLTPHKNGFVSSELDDMGIWHKNAHYFWWEIAKIGNPFIDAVRFLIYRALNAYNNIEARKIAKMVKEKDIDVIHSNSSTINIGELVSKLTGIPHIWHLRELGKEDFSLMPVRKQWDLRRVVNSDSSHFVAISEYVKKYYEDYITHQDRIHVIYNGISSSYNYCKQKDDYIQGKQNFLISGNYCEEKGQIDVAQAVKLLVEQGYSEFKVYMAGRGDFIEVKKFVADNKLTDFVEFCGLVDDMISLRKKCDVEIVASRAEAFGRVTIEAMRASNPVIGSATGGTTELIKDGMNGFLYKYKDNESLADCMRRFIENHSLSYEMGQRAHEWSLNRFTSEDNVNGILELYDSITQKS